MGDKWVSLLTSAECWVFGRTTVAQVYTILLDTWEQCVFWSAIARPHQQLFASDFLVLNRDSLGILIPEDGIALCPILPVQNRNKNKNGSFLFKYKFPCFV